MFGINDNGNQQNSADPSGPPPPVPPPVDPSVPVDSTPVMPMPDQMVAPQNPIADPSAAPQTADSMPDPLTTPTAVEDAVPAVDPMSIPPGSEPEADNSVNGVAADNPYAIPETPQITSNYDSKPGTTPLDGPVEDELIDIKKKALESLAPLVDELDQTPEEKFKTTMMLIQASDNADLVKDAFAAANAIADEKGRAQALLDVVNEINYFTHKQEPEA